MGNDRPEDRGGRGVTVIYLDELFLLNFVVDYLLLLAAGRLSGEILRRGWLALGAAIGAAYAAAAVLPGMGFLLHPLCKLGAAVLALLAGYGKSRRLLRVSLVFFAVSAAFGGGVFALQLLGGRGLTLQNGIFYSAMDLRLILLSAAGCYVLITLLFQRTARHSGLRRELVPAVLTLEGRRVALTALVDTGNTLTDPATGRPVMVAEGEKVGALFPDGQAPAPEELRRRWRPWSGWAARAGRGGAACCPTRRWGWSAACCWPCAWTGRGWGRRTTASCCWHCPPPASPTGAAITR